MGTNKKRYSDAKDHSMAQIFDFANAYYSLSEVLTESFPSDMNTAGQIGYNMGMIAASATNRILALELYLKALIVGRGLPLLWDHDLVSLFESLDKHTRDELASYYGHRRNMNTGPQVWWSMTLYFRLGISRDPLDADVTGADEPFDESLAGLLERNRHGFVLSRYLFQQTTFDKVNTFDYEFRRLGVICELIREGILSGMSHAALQSEEVIAAEILPH